MINVFFFKAKTASPINTLLDTRTSSSIELTDFAKKLIDKTKSSEYVKCLSLNIEFSKVISSVA